MFYLILTALKKMVKRTTSKEINQFQRDIIFYFSLSPHDVTKKRNSISSKLPDAFSFPQPVNANSIN